MYVNLAILFVFRTNNMTKLSLVLFWTFLTLVNGNDKNNLAMQHVRCEKLDINDKWELTWETGIAEAGIICKFDLTNNLQPWTLNDKRFTCGTSSTRMVMCKKGFEIIKKVHMIPVLIPYYL